MADVSHGPLRTAFEVTFKSDKRLASDKHAALVALCRLLSDQIDGSGAEATNRLTAAYLSALKDIERVMAGRTPGTQGGGGLDAEKGGSGGKLGQLQAIAGGRS